jgi:hypothetical protein
VIRLIHFLAEQKAKQVGKKIEYSDAHYNFGVPAENEVSGGTRGSILPSSTFNNTIESGTIDQEFTKDGRQYIHSVNFIYNNVTGAKITAKPISNPPQDTIKKVIN